MALEAPKRVLTVIGDAEDIATWSNIPYFFLRAGRRAGFLHRGLRLHPSRLRSRRLFWNARRLVSGRAYGGFQYSSGFLARLFAQDPVHGESEILSHFPLLPPEAAGAGRVSYYIDATLSQIFFDYGAAACVGKSVVRDALDRERATYERAAQVVCFSTYPARSLVADYGVPATKVHIVTPGANLFEEQILEPMRRAKAPDELRPLRLGFIGKDWRRKGLPFLLEVAQILTQRRVQVEVVVVGPAARRLPPAPYLQSVGFVDKKCKTGHFVELVRSFHFGCLFSLADASPIANLECLRLGVPVLTRRVGGIADTVPEDLGYLFEPEAAPDEIADLLAGFVASPESYWQLRARVADRAEEFSWDRTVASFVALWQGSDAFSYDRVVGSDG